MNYDSIWTAKAQPIPDPEEERALIAQAKAGDQDATMRLIRAYLPVLRKAVEGWKQSIASSPAEALEEARGAAMVGFLEAVQQFDPDRWDRLAATVRYPVAREMEAAAGQDTPVYVPPRMRARYFSLMEKADQDPSVAVTISRDFGMTAETFTAVYEAVNNTVWYHQGVGGGVDGDSNDGMDQVTGEDILVAPEFTAEQVDTDNQLMVAQAFAAIEHASDWLSIVRLYYGFTARDHAGLVDVDTQAEYDAAVGSDSNTAKATFSTRPTVQRKRNAALAAMRESLGAST